MLGHWNTGMNAGSVDCWIAGVLEYWNAEALDCCALAGML